MVESTINAIKNLFETYGESDYIGESITQLEHSIQAGILALNEKRPNTVIIASFLHDIGHLVGLSNKEIHDIPQMLEPNTGLVLGIQKHEELGANYLKHLGFPPSITIPIKNHVLSKRYLLSTDNKYSSLVSSASIATFTLQGGLLSSEEIETFANSPYFEESILVRKYDDLAKDPNMLNSENKQVYLNQLFDIIFQELSNHK